LRRNGMKKGGGNLAPTFEQAGEPVLPPKDSGRTDCYPSLLSRTQGARRFGTWIPACAGMTHGGRVRDKLRGNDIDNGVVYHREMDEIGGK